MRQKSVNPRRRQVVFTIDNEDLALLEKKTHELKLNRSEILRRATREGLRILAEKTVWGSAASEGRRSA